MRFRSVALGAVLTVCAAACGGGGGNAAIGSVGASTTEPSTTAPVPTTLVPTTTPTTPPTTAGSTVTTSGVTTTRRVMPPPLATSTTEATGIVRCSAAALTVEVTTDKTAYRPGERVRAQALLRNGSASPCLYNSYTGSQHFEGPGGQAVSPTVAYIADAFADSRLAAGATLTQSPAWDQQACTAGGTCAPAPPGTYTVKASWAFEGTPVEGSATFRLTAA